MESEINKLEGEWYELPFANATYLPQIAAIYESLAETHSPNDILILKRIPTALDALEQTIQKQTDLTNRPRVESLPRYAARIVEIHDPTIELLSYEQRIELLARVIERVDWEEIVETCQSSPQTYAWPQHKTRGQLTAFLKTASRQENFRRDLGQLLLDATRQGGFEECRSDDDRPMHILLGVFEKVNDQFRELLDDRGYVERRRLVPRASQALTHDETRAAIEAEFEAVLVMEFEECSPTDRDLLGLLTANADLAVVGTPHASVQRTKTESQSLDDVVAEHDLTPRAVPDYGADSADVTPAPHRAIPDFLGTGSTDRDEGRAYYLDGETFDEQLSNVANEIEFLVEQNGWEYRDFAVVVNRLGSRLADARRQLRVANVPTRAVGMPALRDDPVVTECYAFVQYLLDREELAEQWLDARVDNFSPDLVEACNSGGIRPSIDKWIVNSSLKERIADRESQLDAKAQFENLDRIRDLAQFVDETDLVADGWQSFRDVFDQALRFDAGYAHELEVTPTTEGVTVTDVRGVKYDSFECVFLLDVIESEYPGRHHSTNLFPTPWLESMTAYPSVTQPTEERLLDTFPEAAETDGVLADTFDAYHRFRERRKLALGTRAATERLYLCSYETTGGGLGKTHNDSRYLELLRDHPAVEIDEIPTDNDDGARPLLTRKNVSERVFGEPWSELERILQAAYTGDEVDLEDSEEVFGAIRSLLEDSDMDPVFAEAIRTQFSLARGEVVASD